MSLSAVVFQLNTYADSAALKARQANDPDSICGMTKAAEQFKALAAMVQEAIESESARRGSVSCGKPRPREVPHRQVSYRRHGGRAGMSAFQFWHGHGQAVQAIIGEFGLNWKIKAPIGQTILVTVPPCWRSGKTERGGTVRWSADHRMPSAGYWPGGELPAALTVSADYDRHTAGVVKSHDPGWHHSRGYVWDGKAWVFEIAMRNSQNHADGVVAYKEAKRLAKCDDNQQMAAE